MHNSTQERRRRIGRIRRRRTGKPPASLFGFVLVSFLVLLLLVPSVASQSLLDQLLNSLSKLASTSPFDDETEEHDDDTEESKAHAWTTPPNDSTTTTNSSDWLPSHRQRLALYQTSIHRHYVSLWNQLQPLTTTTSTTSSTSQSSKPTTTTTDLRTWLHIQALWDHVQALFFVQYEVEPSVVLNTETDEEDKPDTAESAQKRKKEPGPSSPYTVEQWLADYRSLMAQRHGGGGGGRTADSGLSSLSSSGSAAFPPFPPSKLHANRRVIVDMLDHAYSSYIYHGFDQGHGEVSPLSCQPRDFDLVPLSAVTLVDALDVWLLVGNTTEFARSVERLRHLHVQTGELGLWHVNANVSVFETTIRLLGGLLSAHQLATAWLPPVLIWDHQVFVNDNEEADRLGDDNESARANRHHHHNNREEHSTRPKRRVRTGRDDAILGVCPVVHDDDDNDDENHNNHNPNDPLSSSSSSSSTADPHIACHPLSSSSSMLLPQALTKNHFPPSGHTNNVWKNATRTKTKLSPDQMWSYDGFLLDLAVDLGRRLLPAFDTATGIPYGTVHLQDGIPPKETPIASLAGGGTLVLEFELLSHLTGDPDFANAAQRATRALWMRQSLLYLLGKHIHIQTGTWTETLSGIGSNSDSFTEYMAKHFFLFANHYSEWTLSRPSVGSLYSKNLPFFAMDQEFWILFVTVYSGLLHELRRGDWYVDADMQAGARVVGRQVLEALTAFVPGMQLGVGHVAPAARSLNAFFLVREYLGFLPERFSYQHWRVDHGAGAGKHLLRPELLESAYFLQCALVGTTAQASTNHGPSSSSSSSGWLWASDFALAQLQHYTRAPCGFASLSDVRPHSTGRIPPVVPPSNHDHPYGPPDSLLNVKRMDEMPSFFLTETLKYLYLTFDPDNRLHQDAWTRNWVFTTEAHPIHTTTISPGSNMNNEAANHGRIGSKDNEDKKHGMQDDKDDRGLVWLEQLLKQRIKGERIHVVPPQYQPSSSTTNRYKETNSQRSSYHKGMLNVRQKQEQVVDEQDEQYDDDIFFGSVVGSVLEPRNHQPSRMTNPLESSMVDPTSELFWMWSPWSLDSAWHLPQACPNLQAPELLWMHALQGGALDYVPRFISRSSTALSEEEEEDDEHDTTSQHEPVLLAPTYALAHYHSWPVRYPNDNAVEWWHSRLPKSCRVATTKPTSTSKQEQTASHNSSQRRHQHSQQHEQTQSHSMHGSRIEEANGYMEDSEGGVTGIQTEMGHFQIKAFDAGSGFAVEHLDTGDVLTSTFVHEEHSRTVFFMVHAVFPKVAEHDEHQDSRVVVMGDTNSNSFTCNVELVEQKSAPDNKSTSEKLLHRVPCTPALFGPTHMAHLAERDDLIVEGNLLEPDPENSFGCAGADVKPESVERHDEDEEETCPNHTIQFVHRGSCSFVDKSAKLKQNTNTHGVIVINSDSDDVFIMSYGPEDMEYVKNPSLLPVTVLVSGNDGSELLHVSSQWQSDKGKDENLLLSTRIALRRQSTEQLDPSHSADLNSELDLVHPFQFPLVRASMAALRIFSRSGWGIQAVQQMEDNGRTQWHLQLLRHQFDEVPKQETSIGGSNVDESDGQESREIPTDDLTDP